MTSASLRLMLIGVPLLCFSWGCARDAAKSPTAEEKAMIAQAKSILAPQPAAVAPATAPPASPASPIELLKDQNDQLFSQRHGTTATVMLMVNAKWRDEATKWSTELLTALPPTCQLVHVLDLKDSSHSMAKFVAAGVRVSAGADEAHVYMDWDGAVCAEYNLPRTEPAVIALDQNRHLIKQVVGGWTEERCRAIAEAYTSGR